MALSEDLEDLLPYLRRYARALTGMQPMGDDLVRRLLEEILDGTITPEAGAGLRAFLFGTITRYQDELLARSDILPQALKLANTPGRRALLLTAMENLSAEEAASALGLEPAAVGPLSNMAVNELISALSTTALIIEDEPFIAHDLKRIIEDLGHTVVATAATHADAVTRARMHKPRLILADVRLADESSGVEAVEDITAFNPAPVIFITAYPEQLLTGERPEPAFLIPKPFAVKTVQAVVCQVLLMQQMRRPNGSA